MRLFEASFKRKLGARVVIVAALLVPLFALDGFMGTGTVFVSSELRFTDASEGGLAIIPASCPSSPHYSGDCGYVVPCPAGTVGTYPSCTPIITARCADGSPAPNGNPLLCNFCPTGQIRVGGQCVPSTTPCPSGSLYQDGVCTIAHCPVGYVFQEGSCVAVNCPAGYLVEVDHCVLVEQCFIGYAWNGRRCVFSGCPSGYYYDGRSCVYATPTIIQWLVSPNLVRSGNTASVLWNVIHVSSCQVSGNNGDAWSGASGAQVTSPITAQTTYTLSCIGLDNSIVTRTATVNIVPIFQEQ